MIQLVSCEQTYKILHNFYVMNFTLKSKLLGQIYIFNKISFIHISHHLFVLIKENCALFEVIHFLHPFENKNLMKNHVLIQRFTK